MAQAGFTPISLYYSTTATTVPSSANLVAGELALNIANNDMSMYMENASGTVKLFFNNPAALKYPTADGTNGQAIVTNGAGVLSWTTITSGATISNDTSTASDLYPSFLAATSGSALNIYTSNAKLLYKPSTGELKAYEIVASNGVLVNNTTIANNYTVASGTNAVSIGSITINGGIAVTVSTNQRWIVF
jgi:hypothetical protein